jgi:hypothetical protein
MKRILSLLLSLALICSMVPTVLAADGSQSNFQKGTTYAAGHFTDVPADQWYADSVAEAYEYGLINGTSESTYSPSGDVTVADTLALACRLHDIYYGGTGDFTEGAPWYQVYVDYATDKGIISAGQFGNYSAAITRAQFAALMAKALPEEALPAINQISVGSLPDVPASASFASAVYTLYNAGILVGHDNDGTFRPESSIKRSEVATIVVRMADPDQRQLFTPGSGEDPVSVGLEPATAYDCLVSQATANGFLSDDHWSYYYDTTYTDSSQITYILNYYPESQKISLDEIMETGSMLILIGVDITEELSTPYLAVSLSYLSSGEQFATGSVYPETFSIDTPLSLDYYDGPSATKDTTAYMLTSGVALSLLSAEEQLLSPAGYSLADFGFTQLS